MGTLPREPSEKQVIEYYQALNPTDPAISAVNTFDLLLSDGLLTTRAAEEVLSKIMAFVSISRSLATKVDRGPKFGGIWKAAKGVAPYDFHTLESIFGPNEKKTYTSVCSNWVPNFDNAGRNEESARKGNSRGFWSKVAVRRLAIATFAPMLELAAIWGSGPETTRLAQEQRIEKAFNNKDHGLSWLLGVVIEDPAIEPGSITNAAMIARYLARRSPKLRALATILATHVPRRERVLVLAEHPATQWLIELFLMVVGLGVASIKQDTSHEDRAELLTEFSNGASTKFDVLVSTVRLLGTGLNAHRACHVLVLPDATCGSGYTVHAIGRVHRLGQEHRQHCYQLSVKDSQEKASEFMAPRSSASTPAKRQRQGTDNDTESDDSSSDELPLKKLRHAGRQDSLMGGQDTPTPKLEPKPKLAPTPIPKVKSEDTP
ncbi:P-loop containing nucleoside triphosphate hydrolase protein [Phyllosticta citribraziliensis]|uniref:P-loop containing nucleoside triphosphate hydrolase protein n=1 Tax=Phyllosticta citribraziliensis TaxID=989973 RepID=A0ABR1M9Q7_9PEZI